MDVKTLLALLGSGASLCITVGVYMTKIKQIEKNIDKLEKKQDTTDQLLQSINTQLTELNTKMSLLLRGKINVDGVANG